MVSRKGLTNLVLNAIVGLVIVAVIFASSFFVYTRVVDALTNSQVTKGFTNFIKPIEEVCQGKSSGISYDINLPSTGDYVYGIIQTKLNPNVGYTPNMPLLMKKCENSYCLCLFRFKKPANTRYEFWNDTNKGVFDSLPEWLTEGLSIDIPSASNYGPVTPAPLWHFNKAGLRIMPTLITRILQFYIMRLVQQVINWIVPRFVGGKICQAICCASTAGVGCPGCWFGCEVGVYAAVTALTYAATNAIVAFYEELTEPFILVNYPLNFMSVPDDGDSNADEQEYLYWSGGYDDDYYEPEMAVAAIDSTDLKAIRAAWREGFIEGAIDGFFNGVSSGAGKIAGTSVANKRLIRFAQSRGLEIALRSIGAYAALGAKKDYGIHASEFDMPETVRPKAYIRTLLSIRREMDLQEFIVMNSEDILKGLLYMFTHWTNPGIILQALGLIEYDDSPVPPEYIYSYDEGVSNFETLDVINCVSLSDLGPECDSDTKILMDYDHDMFISYRVTDPYNFPSKAIFCAYDAEKAGINFNFIDAMVESTVSAVETKLNTNEDIKDFIVWLIEGLGKLINIVIGDWLLAGQQRITGLLMECTQSFVNTDYRSEYFQYWIPYYDTTGFTNTDNQISVMTAKLIPLYSDSTECKYNILNKWKSCIADYFNIEWWETTSKTGLTCKIDEPSLLEGGGLLDTLEELGTCDISVFYQQKEQFNGLKSPESDGSNFNSLLKQYSNYSFNLCVHDGRSSQCSSFSWTDLRERNISCVDLYHPQYLLCNPGIHVNFVGVIQ